MWPVALPLPADAWRTREVAGGPWGRVRGWDEQQDPRAAPAELRHQLARFL